MKLIKNITTSVIISLFLAVGVLASASQAKADHQEVRIGNEDRYNYTYVRSGDSEVEVNNGRRNKRYKNRSYKNRNYKSNTHREQRGTRYDDEEERYSNRRHRNSYAREDRIRRRMEKVRARYERRMERLHSRLSRNRWDDDVDDKRGRTARRNRGSYAEARAYAESY